MNEDISKKIARDLKNPDELKAKLNAVFEKLNKSNMNEIANLLGSMDKSVFSDIVNNMSQSEAQKMDADKDDLKKKAESIDVQQLAKLLSENGDSIQKMLKKYIK